MTRDQIRVLLSDEQVLAVTLFGEAAGEGIEGLAAVGAVIRNRALAPRWWGNGYRGVCLKRAQFSCWWGDDANTDRVYAVAEQLLVAGPMGERSLMSEIRWIAAGVVGEQIRDNTRGADHYLTSALFRSPECPSWAKGRQPVAAIGGHVFLRLEL